MIILRNEKIISGLKREHESYKEGKKEIVCYLCYFNSTSYIFAMYYRLVFDRITLRPSRIIPSGERERGGRGDLRDRKEGDKEDAGWVAEEGVGRERQIR